MSWIGQPLPPGWTVEWGLPREDRAGWHHIVVNDVNENGMKMFVGVLLEV